MADLSSVREPIEYDPEVIDRDDVDSVFDTESRADSTVSASSSLYEYYQIQGRTYQSSKTTEYWAPNDEQHLEAFDVAHQWIKMMMGDELYMAPIGDNPQEILDVGTGTGIWAIEMAESFPSAQVVGVDITPTQPPWVPPNLCFQIDDVQLDWTFPENHFDFIHIRYLHGAIDDWPKLYRQMYKHLKPGGWFQHLEPDIEMRSDNPDVVIDDKHIFKQWTQLFYDYSEKTNRTFEFSDGRLERYAADAGFAQTTRKTFKIPMCDWPRDKKVKEIGSLVKLYMDMGLDGFVVLPLGQILGWSPEEMQVLVARMRHEAFKPRNMATGLINMVYGQKPMTSSGND